MAGQVWGTANLGGNLALPYLTDWFRTVAQPLTRFRQLCDIKEAIGKRKGESFQWEIFANIATQGTTLTETNAMPTSSFTMTLGSCTLTEFGNSIPLTRKVVEFSELEIKSILRQTLVNDMNKALDQYIFNQFKAGLLIAQASNSTDASNIMLYTDGTGTVANNATCWLHTGHVVNIVDTMKERNIPAFDGEDYVCISHPSTLTNLRISLESVNQYTETGYKKILNGEVGRFNGVRFVEQTNIGKVTPTNAGASSWALFVGGEACIEAITQPEELIEKEVTDYGRSIGMAWYAIMGYALPFSTAANQRSVMWWPNASAPNGATYA